MFDRQPNHWQQVRNDQNHVLGHLGPGHGTHTAQERAHQDTGQTGKNTHFESQTGQTSGDQADTINLCHHIGEGAQDGSEHANQTGQVAFIAGTQKVRNGELAELAQVGRQKERHQAVTAGPTENESQAAVTREVQRSGHADERRRRHPVSAGRHTVVDGWHASAGHIVFGCVIGPAHHADTGIEQHRGSQKQVADPGLGQAHLLQDGQHDHESNEASGVPGVDLVQAFFKVALRLVFTAKHTHYSSPSETPYSMSSLFM